MKATGIVRRIDDLGRVVIPKEIRRTMHIREGEPLEIYTSADGEVIFKKYSPIGELGPLAEQYAEVLAKQLSCPVLVCDRDHVIAAGGQGRRDYVDQRVSQPLEKLMDQRTPRTVDKENLIPCEGAAQCMSCVVPILTAGDVIGAMVSLVGAPGGQTAYTEKLLAVAAAFFAKQMEG